VSVRIPTHRVPTHPGAMLVEECLRPMGLLQCDLAKALHVSYQRINTLVKGWRGITSSMALRPAKYFSMSAAFCMNLQLRWDLYEARQAEAKELAMIQPHPVSVHAVG
jgi:addiction module HigA family antidote